MDLILRDNFCGKRRIICMKKLTHIKELIQEILLKINKSNTNNQIFREEVESVDLPYRA